MFKAYRLNYFFDVKLRKVWMIWKNYFIIEVSCLQKFKTTVTFLRKNANIEHGLRDWKPDKMLDLEFNFN